MEFKHDARRSIGATDSAHEAVFGEYEGQDVIVKPFRSRQSLQKANNEMLRTRQARNKGVIAPKPIDVIGLKQLKVALYISEYMPGIIGAHTLSYESDPESEAGQALKVPVSSIAKTLGSLHGHRMTHGDPQVKNFGFRSNEVFENPFTKPVVFDFEGASTYSEKGLGNEMFETNKRNDLRKLMLSLGGRQYGGQNLKTAEEIMRETVIETYLATQACESLGSIAVATIVDNAREDFHMGREGKRPTGGFIALPQAA